MVKIPIRGSLALLAASAVVGVTLLWLPRYRLFFVISVGIGLVVAILLYSWHKVRPMRDEDNENKHPLGLE